MNYVERRRRRRFPSSFTLRKCKRTEETNFYTDKKAREIEPPGNVFLLVFEKKKKRVVVSAKRSYL